MQTPDCSLRTVGQLRPAGSDRFSVLPGRKSRKKTNKAAIEENKNDNWQVVVSIFPALLTYFPSASPLSLTQAGLKNAFFLLEAIFLATLPVLSSMTTHGDKQMPPTALP